MQQTEEREVINMSNDNVRKIEDDELDKVVGGIGYIELDAGEQTVNSSRIPFACRKGGCGEIFYIKAGVSLAVCPKCHSKYEIKG